MAQQALGHRVSALEKTVGDLATRQDLQAVRNDLRAEMQTVRDELREEIRAGDRQTRDELHGFIEQRTTDILVAVAAGDAETRSAMRVLHEDVIERIARLRG